MTWSAPSAYSRLIFSSLLAQATTVAPAILARNTQQVPTPPLAPRMRTRSPAVTFPCVTIIRCAVP